MSLGLTPRKYLYPGLPLLVSAAVMLAFAGNSLRVHDGIARSQGVGIGYPGQNQWRPNTPLSPPDSPVIELPYPLEDRTEDFYNTSNYHNLDLRDPRIISQGIEYDPITGEFIITERVDEYDYRFPSIMSYEEFTRRESKKQLEEYWAERSRAIDLIAKDPNLELPYENLTKDPFSNLGIGNTTVDIRPKGNIELIFGASFQNIQNPTLPENARKQGGFDFDMNINMSVTGKIGDKLQLTTNYNTLATFDFDKQVKIQYEGEEDQIIQLIEAGNVSFPLRTSLITGSQGLWGFKSKLKFGRLSYTGLLSIQKSKRENVRLEGGAQTRDFEIASDQYDENRHFFLGHYFRNNYEQALATLPVINSPVNITRIEVWITNSTGITENTRDVVCFMDLGETERLSTRQDGTTKWTVQSPLPVAHNGANNLYSTVVNTAGARKLSDANKVLSSLGLEPIADFEKTRGRKLSQNEFTLQPQLGFISLNQQLKPDEVLGVAYEFTYQGQTYRVGEFSQDVPYDPDVQNVLILKMLKSVSVRPRLPIWDLMMKNVYSLGAFQVSSEDFYLDVYYQDPGGGEKRYIPQGEGVNGKPILQLLDLDRLNNNLDPQRDGVFDFIPGITINPANGKVIFPVVEPFGDHLRSKFLLHEQNIANKYVYDLLYDSTKVIAQQFPQFNRFLIKGRYKSSVSNEIYLGAFNIPRGSVTVTSGGAQLREGIDYTIDYNLGRVKILNEGILNSGQPVNISYENSGLFAFETKTLIGNRFDFWINDNFTIGATHLHLSERPYTKKVGIGNDPIANSIYGLDLQYNTEVPFVTRLVDRLPFYSTTEKSSLSILTEGAWFKPGEAKAIKGEDKQSRIYIDDFEGSKSSYDLKFPYTAWVISSTPNGATDVIGNPLFPESALFDSLPYGYNRAKLVWYSLDPVFTDNNPSTPSSITPDMQSNHCVRAINEKEIFEKDPPAGQPQLQRLPTFDLAYYPEMKGPYNYEADPNGQPGISAGLNPNGSLKDPRSRWGGIMRSLYTNDFEAANVEFIEFWVMDPFDNKGCSNASEGSLYFNLGSISEDILKDSRKFFENGLPKPGTPANLDTTAWGVVPKTQAIVNAFDTDPEVLKAQDLGYNGLDDANERLHFNEYLSQLSAAGVDQAVLDSFRSDPSGDNFIDYLDQRWESVSPAPDIPQRYAKFDGAQGNTSVTLGSDEFSHGTNLPHSEDLNGDNTLNETEEYFQYQVELFKGMDVGNHPFITDVVENEVETWRNGDDADSVKWYHFKIPIDAFNARVGGIQDFKSIRFVRMFLTDFDSSVVLRFARLELVRNQWRRYQFDLLNPQEQIKNDDDNNTFFNVSAVSIEENSKKEPIPYVIPPGVEQEQFLTGSSSAVYLQNEQALSMEVCGLADGDSRAIFKTLNFDFRKYEGLEMFLHAESYTGSQGSADELLDDEMIAFIRLGSDFTENYYEYAIPLKVTTPADIEGKLGEDLKEAIWPAANKMDIALEIFVDAKKSRNAEGFNLLIPFVVDTFANGATVTVTGNPDLGKVKVAMIGLRNHLIPGVMGGPLCAEVWVNELRLKGVDDRGGVAGLVRADLQMADLGNATFALAGHTIGFGQIEQQIDDRFKDNFRQFDVSTNLELGKLLPKNLGIRIPAYAGISRSISQPEFDPFDYDITLKDKLATMEDAQQRKDYVRDVSDYTAIRSLNFTNVRKERSPTKKKIYPWDIENWSATYAFTETFRTNPIIAHDLIRKRKGALAYTYTARPKYIEPLKKVFKKGKYLALLRDFNFNLIPATVSVRNELNRQYGELVLRDLYGDALIDTTYNKYFTWDRYYDVRLDLTKSIKVDFSAVNRTRIDEPDGKIDSEVKKDTIRQNILALGRNIEYRHNATVNYTLPWNKLPVLDWVSTRAAYQASYGWNAAPLTADTLGNTIQNSNSIRVNGELNTRNAYNKIPFLKKHLQPTRPGTTRPQAPAPGRDGAPGRESESKPDEKKSPEPTDAAKGLIGVLTSLKRVTVTYDQTNNTILPGYIPRTKFLGQEQNFTAPGWDFITGYQPDDPWLDRAADKGWITPATSLNFQFIQGYTENLDVRVNFEPFKDLRLDLSWKTTYSQTRSEYFRYDPMIGDYAHLNPYLVGSYSQSFIAWNTAFDKFDKVTSFTKSFTDFLELRQEASQALGFINPNSEGEFEEVNAFDTIHYPGFADGYGRYSQEVLIPAFIAAYGGRDLTGYDLSPIQGNKKRNWVFRQAPKPNWRLTYNGLSRVKPLDKYFSAINFTHGYTSTISINQFASDFSYHEALGHAQARDTLSGNFYPLLTMPSVIINEQLAPLIGVDFTMKNSITGRIEIKKSRIISLGLIDYQVIETKSTEFVIGGGYRMKGFQLPFKVGGKKTKLENDLNWRFDFSIRDDKTVNYQLDQNTAEPTRGGKTISISPSVDYVVNQRLNIRLFFDRRANIPAVSESFPVSNTNVGVAVRFTLAE